MLTLPSRARAALPWLVAVLVCASAAAARTFLIQPPEIAHFCDSASRWWCEVRMAIIYTYAWHTIGQVAVVLTFLAFFARRAWLSCAAMSAGAMALVLYCFEPGAFALVSGALLLLRNQAQGDGTDTARSAEQGHYQYP